MYTGGKSGNGTYQTIINQIPDISVYFELFAGDAGVFRHLKPGLIACLNDIEPSTCSHLSASCPGNPVITNIDAVTNIKLFSLIDSLFYAAGISVFWYLDPPYPFSVRKSISPLYSFEMSDEDHIVLLNGISCFKGYVAISSYRSELYDSILGDWRRIDFWSQTRHGKRLESLYCNYPEVSHLYDYRYIGKNFRERELIQKSCRNQLRKLRSLPEVQLNSILSELITSTNFNAFVSFLNREKNLSKAKS